MIERIDENFLADKGNNVSVAIIDSGFPRIPAYAKVYGANYRSSIGHGDRILSIFTALDERHPLSGLKLNLACYSTSMGYGGLINALKMLPESDILSISISWRDDNEEIRSLIERKFKIICVPYSDSSIPYPGAYGFTITCSNVENPHANYCIRPHGAWRGNSYAVPAIARLMCYGIDLNHVSNEGVLVEELFGNCVNGVKETKTYKPGKQLCQHCHRYMRDPKTHGYIVIENGTCPYCGFPLK